MRSWFILFLSSVIFTLFGCSKEVKQAQVPAQNESKISSKYQCNMPDIEGSLKAKFSFLVKNGELNFTSIYQDGEAFEVHNDALFKEFVACGKFEDFTRTKLVMPNGAIMNGAHYLDPEKAWDKKVKVSWKIAKAVNEKTAVLAKKVKHTDLSMENFHFLSHGISRQMWEVVKQSKVATPVGAYLDGDVLMGLTVHELIPTDYWDYERPQIFRVLLEQGFQPHLQPAVYDGAASYGIGQMTYPTYGDTRAFAKRLGVALPPFEECFSLEEQMKSVVLHQHYNFYAIYRKLFKKPEFTKLWKKGSDKDRKVFVATLAGVAHSLPLAAHRGMLYLMKDLEAMESLIDMRQGFLSYIKGFPIAYRHGYRSGDVTAEVIDLFTEEVITVSSPAPIIVTKPSLKERLAFWWAGENADKSDAPLNVPTPTPTPSSDPTPDPGFTPPPSIGPSEEETKEFKKIEKEVYKKSSPLPAQRSALDDLREVKKKYATLPVVLRMLPQKKGKTAYFVYTVPQWKLSRVAQALCKHPKTCIGEIKDFMDAKKLFPGDVILVPISLLKDELKNGTIRKISKSSLAQKDYDFAVLYSGVLNVESLGSTVRVPALKFGS
jgi:hypothetical protein